ncbi:MAG: T9SS type A sorting domain-containing protein [Bacteroidetes bacterium]|nr:T9SS type A sorting domain-containing protein [Bacteroidota bacterium]MBU1718684.1 T9SS type A sorting domain-containing protein [Bacteroidota bacterium]
MRFLISFILSILLTVQLAAATASMSVSGNFFGDNLLIFNPFNSADASSFSISAIQINGKNYTGDIAHSTIEIDFLFAGLSQKEKVEVKITYNENRKPKVLNPEALKCNCNFSYTATKYDKKSDSLFWNTLGEQCALPFIVEQKRWNRWIKVGEVMANGDPEENIYGVKVIPNSGSNIFRIRQTSPRGEEKISNEIKYRLTGQPIVPEVDRAGTKMSFSGKTLYEIYNEYGNLVLSGYSNEVNISTLPKGLYVMNFDTETVMFAKK